MSIKDAVARLKPLNKEQASNEETARLSKDHPLSVEGRALSKKITAARQKNERAHRSGLAAKVAGKKKEATKLFAKAKQWDMEATKLTSQLDRIAKKKKKESKANNTKASYSISNHITKLAPITNAIAATDATQALKLVAGMMADSISKLNNQKRGELARGCAYVFADIDPGFERNTFYQRCKVSPTG